MGANLDQLDPDLRSALNELQAWLGSQRVLTTVTSTVRSARDQYGWAFDMVVEPFNLQHAVGQAWGKLWGGKWGGLRDPVHFELPGASQLAWRLGESGAQSTAKRQAPAEGGAFYQLADFLASFVPGLGEIQLVDALVTLLDGHEDLATWYLHHPAEAFRDLGAKIASLA